jgi:hypothetical protein
MRRINLVITAVLVLILGVYLLFLDTLAKPIFERLATEQYGAEVSIDSLELRPFRGKATLYNLQVADRRDAMRNLVQADRVHVDMDVWQLVENVVDVSNMEVDGLLAFAPRATPATILRPLVSEDSELAKVGLPSFEIPDVDDLIDRQRDEIKTELEAVQQRFETVEAKWKDTVESVPGDEEIAAWKARIRALQKPDNPLQALAAVNEAKTVYSEIEGEIQRVRNLRSEFQSDMQMLREQVNLASSLPEKHTRLLVQSLGLDSGQIAQLGQYILRGDLNGLLQQVLAPLAYNASGEAGEQDNAMPVFVRRAAINGSLLPSAAGLSVNGELTDFAWPLANAEDVATLLLKGNSLSGGSLAVNANVDHRTTPNDRVGVDISNLPLKNMALAGTEELGIQLMQTLASVSGELRVIDGKLDGAFTQRFTETVFDTTLREGAGRAAQLIARVLESSTSYLMSIGFGGTLEKPELSFKSDMDELFRSTIESAISESVNEFTNDLNLQLSREIGPEITAAREQFGDLEMLQAELQKNLSELDKLAR